MKSRVRVRALYKPTSTSWDFEEQKRTNIQFDTSDPFLFKVILSIWNIMTVYYNYDLIAFRQMMIQKLIKYVLLFLSDDGKVTEHEFVHYLQEVG